MEYLRKYIVWIGAAVVLLLLLLGGYYFYSSTKSGNGGSGTLPNTENVQGSLPANIRPAPGEEAGGTETATAGEPQEPRLFQIHDKPVVSSVAFIRSKSALVRFIEQGSGHVYEYSFDSKQKTRISNTSIPQIERALWSQDGNTVLFQYDEGGTVRTAVGLLSTTTEESAFKKISFLPEGIESIALSPDGLQVFYIIKGEFPAVGILAKADGTSLKPLFTSPLSQWQVEWATPTSVIVHTPPSVFGGVAYSIRLTDGATTLLGVSDTVFNGAKAATNGQVLATDPLNGRVSLLSTKGEFSDLYDYSWPIKCAFVPLATSSAVCANMAPANLQKFDEWERGEYASNDVLVATNFVQGYKMLLIPQKDLGDKLFDMVELSILPKGNYVVFKNRTDGLLWGVRVPGGIE